MSGDITLKDLVLSIVSEHFQKKEEFPELISIEETAKLMDVSKDTILRLSEERNKNHFPAIQVSQKLIKVNKNELVYWLRNGGLFALSADEE